MSTPVRLLVQFSCIDYTVVTLDPDAQLFVEVPPKAFRVVLAVLPALVSGEEL